MATAPAAADLDAFRGLVESRLGLRFEDSAGARLEQVLRRRLAATGLPVQRYLQLLAGDAREPVLLAGELTTGETYFLRHLEQFRAFTERVVPERLAADGTGRLRLLSAGCSTGEEAYSLAIVLREAAPAAEVAITGVDLNPASLEKARSGRYTSWSLRAVSPTTRRRWFVTGSGSGGEVRLDDDIRAAVTFEWGNLSSGEPATLFQPDSYDAVFCRNVVMYFAPDVMSGVIARLAATLVPGGYLFLGSAETLRGMPSGLELCESHGTFYYRRPDDGRYRPVEPWYDTIRSSTDRVQELTSLPSPRSAPRPPTPGAATPPSAATPPGVPESPELEPVLVMMGEERYADALTALTALSARRTGGRAVGEPEILLLRATALVHLGRFHAAEQTCHRLLGTGEFVACAHLLLALCREVEGDSGDALDRCRAAAGADPRFALPHVHLARLARRGGDLELAAAAAQEAVRLLPAETDRRIMLFGGGFDRAGLIALCRVQAGAGS